MTQPLRTDLLKNNIKSIDLHRLSVNARSVITTFRYEMIHSLY